MLEKINNSRLEAFFDGITAIAITLLILEIKIPELANVHSMHELGDELLSAWPSWISFMLTFLILFIAWSNHHHFVVLLDKTSNSFIYANGLLLVTIVVFPFSTGLLGRFLDTEYSRLPIILYGATNLIHAFAWLIVFIAATKPLDLTKDALARQKVVKTTRIIAYSCVFNLLVFVIAFLFPVVALCLITSAWLFYLFAGITYTSFE